ncbi:MAG: arginine--tRNA ligase [Phycisphaerales bacterium JB047]
MSTQTPESAGIVDPSAVLDERFQDAIASVLPDLPREQIQTHITPSRQPKFGDFQSNCAMPLAKRFGMQPRELAAKIAEAIDVTGIAEPIDESSIAGPGFINITLLPSAISDALASLDTPQLGITPPDSPPTVVVDLCGVNLAKQMHVGHLRSTVIGDAIARLYERMGYKVIRQSHVGDWGLPIAMVVQKLIEREDAGLDLQTVTLAQLNTMYKQAQSECKAETKAVQLLKKVGGHPKAMAELELRIEDANQSMERAKSRLVALQSGDCESVRVWQRIYDITMSACLHTCARLHANVTDEHSAGESTYRDELGSVVQDLIDRNIAEEDDGALVVKCDGIKEPTIIRKRDGGYLYATTDLAAIKRRVDKLGGDIVVYCVDSRQSLHFKQVFAAAHKAGYDKTSDGHDATLVHAMFGSVMGEDGKPLKSRSGENLNLSDLLDEAVSRAEATLSERSPDITGDERHQIAEAVAMAAVKYTDLAIERVKDYIFSFDRMLAFEGDTGPYLLYALVRIKSIFRKAQEAGIDVGGIDSAPFDLREPSEKALALKLLRYPGVVEGSSLNHEPNRLCAYAYELASGFSSFFDQCPVLKNDDESVRASRLRLCALTGRVLEDALQTLGIPTVDRM